MLVNRLRRVTRDGRWIPEVDGLRFVAISSVLLFHMLGELSLRSGRIIAVEPGYWWLERFIGNGTRGVNLFFVISGMILALPFARQYLTGSKPVSLGKYYMRRVTRLEPPYIAAMILAAVLIGVYSHGVSAGFVAHFLVSIFYQHNLVYGQVSTVNVVAWSLEIEIQFYLLAPLVMQSFRIRPKWLRRVLLLIGILGLALAERPFQTWPRVELSILFYLQYFLMGILIADVFVLELERMKSSWLWDIAGVAALFAIFWPPGDTFWPHALMPIPIAVLFFAAMRGYALRRVFSNRWIAVTGGMCYSIYLLHFIFIAVVFKVTRRAIMPDALFFVNYTVQLLLTLVPAVAMCVVFFLLVERPCMDPNWPAKLWHTLTGRPEREAAALETSGISD
jgi:peptidoglycan/LPS O-acetylase OafA/YrhL